jgi:crotonobetainyl-CoA:carnitine CoA-transferase CaiB-like acyl-CoA transferase
MPIPSRLAQFARGIKVLDLSAFLPGPLASLLLADLGAEVLKIEPLTGDPMTQLGPRDSAGRPIYYEAINAGKFVRRMNLKAADQRETFLRLVAEHDVLIEGFRPGVMRRLGLDYTVLREVNPRLVYCALSGYGASGPMAQAAGHDANYLASAGVMHRNANALPYFYDPPLSDVSGSLFGVIAILGALRAREVDGLGCEVDIGLADAPMPLQLFQVAEHGAIGTVPQPRSTYLNGGAAYYQVYPTQDGRHIALGAIEPKFWAQFCEAAGRPDWTSRQSETLPQVALIADVGAHIAALTLEECLMQFSDNNCCVSPVLDLGEALKAPQTRARDLVRRAPSGGLQALFPARVNGSAPMHRAPLRSAAE